MKLIDIVILELSKRGGWPEKSVCVVQDADTQICFSAKTDGLRKAGTDWIGGEWNGPWVNFFSNHLADDHSTSIVTREQYEAALAASKPEWDGNGLPPVGCECEYETKFDGWQPVRIELIKSEGIAFTWLSNSQAYNGLDCVGVQKSGSFRPIRSEADKKRDEAIESIKAMLMYDYGDDPRLNDAVILYDAIAAGKIPHIRID